MEPSSDEGHLLTRRADTDAPAEEVAGGVSNGGDNHAAADVAADDDASVVKGERLRLSKEYVECILSLEPGISVDPDEEYALLSSLPDNLISQEFIDESVQIYRDMAELNKYTSERFSKLQDWMRGEMEEKGYVEVDEDYVAQRELIRRFLEAEKEAQTELWVHNAFGPKDKGVDA